MRRRLAAVLVVAGLAGLAGCGGGGGDGAAVIGSIDTSDPEAVAKAWWATVYACGERGVGLGYDLTYSWPFDESRDELLARERQDGCTPEPVPPIDTVVLDEQPERVVVDVRIEDEELSNARGGETVVLKTDEGWRVEHPAAEGRDGAPQ